MFHMMDIPGRTKPFSNQQAASRKYPLQFLCDFAYAVLDNKTGDLLEYRHLLRHPKYSGSGRQCNGGVGSALAAGAARLAVRHQRGGGGGGSAVAAWRQWQRRPRQRGSSVAAAARRR